MIAPRPAAVDRFLTVARPQRAALIEAVDRCIREAAPELAVELSEKFLGYGPFHYRYDSGREGDAYVVSMMDGAQALSVYVIGNDADGDDSLVEAHAAALGTVSVGKSCIRIKRLEHIDLDVLGQLVRSAVDQHSTSAH